MNCPVCYMRIKLSGLLHVIVNIRRERIVLSRQAVSNNKSRYANYVAIFFSKSIIFIYFKKVSSREG